MQFGLGQPVRREGQVAQIDEHVALMALPPSVADTLARAPVATRSDEPSPWSRAAHGGLPHWRLKRVLAYIDDNIGGDITLKHLADVACLSPHHFSELF